MTNPTLLGCGGHQNGGTGYTAGTYYSNVGLGRCPLGADAHTDESRSSQTIRVPGKISYLSWGTDTAFGTSAAQLTLALNKNSSSTNLAISVGDMTGIVTDGSSSDAVTVSAGDTLDFAATVGSDVSSFSGGFYCVSARFDADTASAQLLAAVGPLSLNPPPTSQEFGNFLGFLAPFATEADQQFQCLAAGTWQHMACYVQSNGYSGTTTIKNQVGSSNGSMAISIPSTTMSGYLEDTNSTHSNSVSVGDKLCYGFSGSGGSGELVVSWIGAHFVASDSTQCMIGGSNGTPATIADTNAKYSSLFGDGEVPSTGTTDATRGTGLIPYTLQASMFTTYVPSGNSGAATFTLQNGTSSVLTTSVTTTQSGYITTASGDTADFDDDDTCSNKISVSTTSLSWAYASVLVQSTS